MNFQQLQNQSLALLDEEGPEAALALLKEHAATVEHAVPAQLYNFLYCFAALAGREEEAMGLLTEAVFAKGFWYDYDYLMADEDLTLLRHRPEFTAVAEACRARQQEALAAVRPVLQGAETLRPGQPFALVLHGDQENAAVTAPYWQAVTDAGCALCLAQSSQVQVTDGYLWDDEDLAAQEIAQHWQTLTAQGGDGILCGFSSGGRAALYAVLEGRVTPKGLILASPWLPELDQWKDKLPLLAEKGVRLALVCGDADPDCFDGTQELFELADDAGVECSFRLCEDVEHAYAPNFPQLLQDAVRFVLNQ